MCSCASASACGMLEHDSRTFRFHDGSTKDVPIHVLARSPTLQVLVGSSSEDAELNTSIPQDVLATWLECVKALSENPDSAKPASPIRVAEYLKVLCCRALHCQLCVFESRGCDVRTCDKPLATMFAMVYNIRAEPNTKHVQH